MLKLNLVSEGLKKEIKLRRVFGILKKVTCYFFLITIIYSIILLSARYLILNKFDEIVAQTTLITKNTQSYNNRVKEINDQVDFIFEAQSNFIRFSCFLNDLKNFGGQSVKIEQLKFSREKNLIIIRGKSNQRTALLAFKEKLENSGLFQNVDLPLKNLLTKEDIDFEITALVDLSKL